MDSKNSNAGIKSQKDLLSSPQRRKKILPGKLKEIYGSGTNNITPNDVKLFLGFCCEKKNQGESKTFYELDMFGESVHSIEKPHKKVYREIDNAILCLQQGKRIEEEKTKAPNISHFRTISMLLSLKYFFKKNNEFNNPFIDELHKFSTNNDSEYIVKSDGCSGWYVSYPLLLVQAIRFSQWEFVNQDYCFEYFTAKRVYTYLEILFQKWFSANDSVSTLNLDVLKKTKIIFTRLIRWQTLEGQHGRATSTFGINDLNCWKDEKNELALLDAVSFVDNIVRSGGAKLENIVCKKLKNHQNADELIKFNFQKSIEEMILNGIENEDKEKSSEEQLKEKVLVWKKRYKLENQICNKKKDKVIWSYSKPVGSLTTSPGKENWKRLKHQLTITQASSDDDEFIIHYIYNQQQRKIGFLRKLYESESLDFESSLNWVRSLPKKEEKKDFIKLSCKGLPEEKIVLIAHEPRYVVNKVYLNNKSGEVLGLDSSENSKNIDNKPLDFLNKCFEAVSQQYDNKIPLPMVKRIIDLLEYYYVAYKEKSRKIFLLRIVFDKGKHQINVWLPKVLSKTQEHGDNQNLTNRVLIRYINFLISNYGMCRQFNHVDLDFSASKNSEHIYKAMMYNPVKCIDCRKNLGLDVFYRYLIDVAIKQMETTYSLEKYIQVIEKRKMINPHLFDKSEIISCLSDKYILGIDIGGTGIKIKFFKITNKENSSNYTLACKSGIDDPATGTIPLFLKPGSHNDNYLEFSLPTLPSAKARMKIEEIDGKWKYQNGNEFAEYIVTTLYNRLENISAQSILDKIISIGFCWPGPIKQNRIASTSGILNNFMGLSNKICANQYPQIMELNIADAVKKAFKNKIPGEKEERVISVALANDGDAEAAGLAFSMCNLTADNCKKTYKTLFEEHSVAIVKCGTGTAGSVLINGEIQGLNEFGKIIIDLNANNSENLSKKIEQRWPKGDANKFFSMAAFRQLMKKNGVPDDAEPKITGRDIDLILTLSEEDLKKKIKIRLFGASELLCIAEPHIEWGDIVDTNTKSIKDCIRLIFKDGSYKIEDIDKKGNANIDEHTWWKLANEPLIQPLHLQADNPLSLATLLLKLGRHRIARLNILEANKKKKAIEKGIENIGKDLADVIALLYDIYILKGVVITGGVMNSEKIRRLCENGLKAQLETYLYDTYHYDTLDRERLNYKGKDKFVVKKLETWDDEQEPGGGEPFQNAKFFFHIPGENNALLGAAILGFDHYVEEEKIKEMQKLATKKEGAVDDELKFLTKKEGIKFMQINSENLKISVDDIGNILSLR